ncbi:hypothetical protein PIB30_017482 [Stylosanthes scabra]|uniref:Uncharacterized protein n=1 Tax=Stylosanthes scabra TaxID=79078 RepID=A0ABU6Z495_9FABA|nr:hypothetical protein [Stylosanthes scabra]
MMVGTRTTARDWQWLDDMMADDAPAEQPTQKVRRMLESYARRRRTPRAGRDGGGRGEGGDTMPTQQTQTQGTAIPSTMSSPSQQAFLDGLSSPGFQQLITDIMRDEGGGGYRPDTQFDGS